jgi:hypothetical protein
MAAGGAASLFLAALDRIVSASARAAAIESEAVEKFSRFMLENAASGAIPFHKADIQSAVDRFEGDGGLIRLVGAKTTPEQPIAGQAWRRAAFASRRRNGAPLRTKLRTPMLLK